MKFTKMHGAGNDYVYVNCFENETGDRPSLARRISDRHFGIGSDGLVCICPSETADFKMDMYNADGSGSQMCGNGIRCLGKYVFDRGMTDRQTITVETQAGIKTLNLEVIDGTVRNVRVDMGSPELRPSKIPADVTGDSFIDHEVNIAGISYRVTSLSVGNPHAVVFVSDVDNFPVEKAGPLFEHSPLFPERVNAEFVQILDDKTLKVRVWERGSGETLACGTGATASLVAACLNGHTGPAATIELPGGRLYIEWDREIDQLYMTGPAETVFDGELF